MTTVIYNQAHVREQYLDQIEGRVKQFCAVRAELFLETPSATNYASLQEAMDAYQLVKLRRDEITDEDLKRLMSEFSFEWVGTLVEITRR